MQNTKEACLLQQLYVTGIQMPNNTLVNVSPEIMSIVQRNERGYRTADGVLCIGRELTLQEKLSTFKPTPEWHREYELTLVKLSPQSK